MFDVRCLMFDVRRTALCTILVAALTGFFSSGAVFADSPSVTAVLSNSEVAVGETVRLQIRITGSDAKPPGQITVDGLDIRQTGTEQHYEMNNFSISQSVIYNYTVLPMKAGKFKIPPQTVQAGGASAHARVGFKCLRFRGQLGPRKFKYSATVDRSEKDRVYRAGRSEGPGLRRRSCACGFETLPQPAGKISSNRSIGHQRAGPNGAEIDEIRRKHGGDQRRDLQCHYFQDGYGRGANREV